MKFNSIKIKNCPSCHGEGLDMLFEICPTCNGEGLIRIDLNLIWIYKKLFEMKL